MLRSVLQPSRENRCGHAVLRLFGGEPLDELCSLMSDGHPANQSLLDYNYRRFAPVAQWTERRTSNPQVVRSIRTRGTFTSLAILSAKPIKILKLKHLDFFI